jgi:hypothetical protein
MIAANAEREYVNRTVLETLDQNNNPIQCYLITPTMFVETSL